MKIALPGTNIQRNVKPITQQNGSTLMTFQKKQGRQYQNHNALNKLQQASQRCRIQNQSERKKSKVDDSALGMKKKKTQRCLNVTKSQNDFLSMSPQAKLTFTTMLKKATPTLITDKNHPIQSTKRQLSSHKENMINLYLKDTRSQPLFPNLSKLKTIEKTIFQKKKNSPLTLFDFGVFSQRQNIETFRKKFETYLKKSFDFQIDMNRQQDVDKVEGCLMRSIISGELMQKLE